MRWFRRRPEQCSAFTTHFFVGHAIPCQLAKGHKPPHLCREFVVSGGPRLTDCVFDNDDSP